VAAFVSRARVFAQPAGDVGADPRSCFLRRFGRGWRRRFFRRGVRARARQVLAGAAVLVTVEVVGVARQEVFLRFRLVGEVGAVVIERLRSGRRGDGGDRGGENEEDKQAFDAGILSGISWVPQDLLLPTRNDPGVRPLYGYRGTKDERRARGVI